MKISNVVRKFFRVVAVFFGLIILYVAFLWLRPDEELNPAARAFYQVQAATIPDEQNASLALLGLYAPLGVDVISHGKRVRKILAETADSNHAWEQVGSLGRLDLASIPEIECWLNGLKRTDTKECASPERLAAIIRESTYLARYKQIQTLTRFDSNEFYRGQIMINLNKLLWAETLLDLEQGRSELAYQKWRTNHLFLTRLNAGGGSWVMTAIGLVDEGISFAMLDDLLRLAPTLIDVHDAELNAMLAPTGIERFNLEGIMRAEEELVRRDLEPRLDLFRRPNYQTNRQYEYAQAFLSAAKSKPENMERSVNAVTSEYGELSFASADYTNLLNGIISRLYVRGQLKTGELLTAMHGVDARQRLNTLRLQIVKAKKSDAEIDAFLQVASPSLRNPFDGKPMRWDPARRTINAVVPGKISEYAVTL